MSISSKLNSSCLLAKDHPIRCRTHRATVERARTYSTSSWPEKRSYEQCCTRLDQTWRYCQRLEDVVENLGCVLLTVAFNRKLTSVCPRPPAHLPMAHIVGA